MGSISEKLPVSQNCPDVTFGFRTLTIIWIWERFVRFTTEDGKIYCGEPVDPDLDIGLAFSAKEPIHLKVLDTKSALDLNASFTGEIKTATSVRIITYFITGRVNWKEDSHTTHSPRSRNNPLRWSELHRPRS